MSNSLKGKTPMTFLLKYFVSGALLFGLMSCAASDAPIQPEPSTTPLPKPSAEPPLPDYATRYELPVVPTQILSVGSLIYLLEGSQILPWSAAEDKPHKTLTLSETPLFLHTDPQEKALYILFKDRLELRSPDDESRLLSSLILPEIPQKLVFSTREAKAWLRMKTQIWEIALSRDRDKMSVLDRIPLSESGHQMLIFDRWLVYDEGQTLKVQERSQEQGRALPITGSHQMMGVVYQEADAPKLVVAKDTQLQLCELSNAHMPCQSTMLPYSAHSLLMVPALGMAYLPTEAEITVLDFVAGQPIDTLKQPAKALFFPPPVVGLQIQHLGDIYGAGNYPVEIWATTPKGITVFNGHTLKVAQKIELPFERSPQVAYAENTAYAIDGQNPRLYAINRRQLGIQLD